MPEKPKRKRSKPYELTPRDKELLNTPTPPSGVVIINEFGVEEDAAHMRERILLELRKRQTDWEEECKNHIAEGYREKLR